MVAIVLVKNAAMDRAMNPNIALPACGRTEKPASASHFQILEQFYPFFTSSVVTSAQQTEGTHL